MKKFILSIAASLLLLSGCVTKKNEVTISQVYPFEGRYSSTNVITINGNEAKVKEQDSLWILSNKSLYNLLVDVADNDGKIVFKNQVIKTIPKDKEQFDRQCGNNWFDDEEYIWEEFIVSTNKAEINKQYKKSFNGETTVMEEY